MKTRTVKASAMAACLVLMAVLFESQVSTHHSFAMYDQTKTVTLTGVMKQFVPQANHAELHFILLAPDHKALQKGADGKYVEWGVEMAGTVAIESAPSTPTCVTAVDIFPPAAPKSLALIAGGNGVSLLWEANTEADLGGYLVLRGEAPDDKLSPLTKAPITDTSFLDTTARRP